MNYTELREANNLMDKIEKMDSLTKDVKSPLKKIWLSSGSTVVTLKNEHKTKVIQVLLEIKEELARELKELGVTEESKDETTKSIY